MPYQFIEERYWRSSATQSVWVRGATAFEDLVVRCVRYAFKNIDTNVGRVFLSKRVALPFVRWRMLRHGYLVFPVHCKEHTLEVLLPSVTESLTHAIRVSQRRTVSGSHIVRRCHQTLSCYTPMVRLLSTWLFLRLTFAGGGFAMGSCYFYLEFLLAWHHLLLEAGFQNPAIFALDYSLVPDEKYPKQVTEIVQGYKHVLDYAQDASKVCVAGDSAGAALILSLLQEVGGQADKRELNGSAPGIDRLPTPHMATLISPWVTLKSDLHSPSEVDFLDRDTLWRYGEDYAGREKLFQWPASPGICDDDHVWRAVSPQRGYFVTYGGEEVLAPDIENFLMRQQRAGVEVSSLKFAGGVHAWTVASLFLSSAKDKRLEGLRTTVTEIRRRFQASNKVGKRE